MIYMKAVETMKKNIISHNVDVQKIPKVHLFFKRMYQANYLNFEKAQRERIKELLHALTAVHLWCNEVRMNKIYPKDEVKFKLIHQLRLITKPHYLFNFLFSLMRKP